MRRVRRVVLDVRAHHGRRLTHGRAGTPLAPGSLLTSAPVAVSSSVLRSLLGACAASLALSACGGAGVPDPKDAVRSFADAAARGDADAIYDMLSDDARKQLTREQVKRLVAEQKGELAERSKLFVGDDAKLKAHAEMRWADGETASLALEDGRFRVSGADAVPVGARTPEQALDVLRRVLARRSFAGLLRVLTPQTRSAIEANLRSLVEGLENPEGLDVAVNGDKATVNVPGGHVVRLRKDGGVWQVEEFE